MGGPKKEEIIKFRSQEQMAVKQMLWGGEKFANDLRDVALREVYFLFRLFLLDI